MRGACVHVARRQVTLGAYSRCDSHIGSSTRSNKSLGVQEFQLRGRPCPALASCADALLCPSTKRTAGEMLQEVHKGLHPINALKVAIDHCLLGVAIHTDRQTAAYVDHVNEGFVNTCPNKRTRRRNAKVCRKSIIHLDNKLNLSPDDVIHQLTLAPISVLAEGTPRCVGKASFTWTIS